jgi:hypothetical protein
LWPPCCWSKYENYSSRDRSKQLSITAEYVWLIELSYTVDGFHDPCCAAKAARDIAEGRYSFCNHAAALCRGGFVCISVSTGKKQPTFSGLFSGRNGEFRNIAGRYQCLEHCRGGNSDSGDDLDPGSGSNTYDRVLLADKPANACSAVRHGGLPGKWLGWLAGLGAFL